MFTIELDFSKLLSPLAINRKKNAMADILLRQTQDRIRNGGDDDYRFPPLDYRRPDGSQNHPLNHTGQHLLASIRSFVTTEGIGVSSNFIGARVQLLGTKGKGGELPPIRPVTAHALFIPMSPAGQKAAPLGRVIPGSLDRLTKGKDYRFAKEVNIRPRKFFRLSFLNRRELVDAFKRS